MDNNPALRAQVLLSLQRALLGEISSQLRGVTCEWGEEEILIEAIFDGEIENSDQDSLECVGSEVAADFPEHRVEVLSTRIDFPSRLNEKSRTEWVYLRKESEELR